MIYYQKELKMCIKYKIHVFSSTQNRYGKYDHLIIDSETVNNESTLNDFIKKNGTNFLKSNVSIVMTPEDFDSLLTDYNNKMEMLNTVLSVINTDADKSFKQKLLQTLQKG